MKKTLFITLTVALALTLFVALGIAASANIDANVITEIKINMDAPEIGKAVPVPTVPEGANYKLSGVSWTLDGDLITDEAVQDGKRYSFSVTVVPNDGYRFDENATVTVGGKKCYNPSVTPETIELSMDYDFREKLAEVSLTVGEIKIGSPAPQYIAPADAPYTVETHWNEYTSDSEISVLEAEYYNVYVRIRSDKYAVTDGTVFKVNGKAVPINQWQVDSNGHLSYNPSYDLRTPIDSVSVTVAEIKAGEKLPEPQVPEGANYEIQYFAWNCNGVDVTEEAAVNGKFYQLLFIVKPKEGYALSKDGPITVNGEKESMILNANFTACDLEFPLGTTPITEISIEIPEGRLGVNAAEMTPTKIPEGVNYTLASSGWLDENGEPITGIIGNKYYVYDARIVPKDGYHISTDVKLTVNGKPSEESGFSASSTIQRLGIYKELDLRTPQTAIDFPAFPELKVGEPLPEVTFVLDGFEFSFEWKEIDEYGASRLCSDGAVVRANTTYQLTYNLYTESDGSVCLSDPKITVGGESVSGSTVVLWEERLSIRKTYVNGGKAPQIKTLALTGSAFQIGQAVPDAVTLPEGYGLDAISYTINLPEGGSEYSGSVFEEGKHYTLSVHYDMPLSQLPADDLTVTYNGTPVKIRSMEVYNKEIDSYSVSLLLDLGAPEKAPEQNQNQDQGTGTGGGTTDNSGMTDNSGTTDGTGSVSGNVSDTPGTDTDGVASTGNGSAEPNPKTSDAVVLPSAILLSVSILAALGLALRKRSEG